MWLKSVGPGSAHEPALAAALGRWAPDHVLVPLAVHEERRLLLLPDGGQTLRAAGGSGSVEAWEAMLRDYAQLQVELIPHAEQMVALGVPDARLERLPELAAELLADDEALLLDRPDGLTSERAGPHRGRPGALRGALPPAGRTSASRPTLQHDDLHDANVFVGDGRHRFFDWGDAVVSHPFVSLLVSLRVAQRGAGGPRTGTPSCCGCATPTSTSGATTAACPRCANRSTWRCRWDRCSGRSPGGGSSAACIRRSGPSGRTAVPGWTAEYLEPGTLTAPAPVQAGH